MLPDAILKSDYPLNASAEAFGLDEDVFNRLAYLVNAECGIRLSQKKSGLLVSRLGRRVKALNMETFGTYCEYLESGNGIGERRKMIALLTTNVTKFFREPHQFDALRTAILPDLIVRARNGARVRIWSAGCSTGEEPFSIAIEVLNLCPEAEKLDLRILATDLDPDSIAKARRGQFGPQSSKNLSDAWKVAYFDAHGEGIKASRKLQSLVTFAELNLMQPWPMQGAFDVIFCRNVVIYFDGETQASLWPRFAAALVQNGTLFIGHSERLSGAGTALFEPAGITQYRRL